MSSLPLELSSLPLFVGVVKWFNTKSGYGFITINDSCDKKGTDVFVYHNSLVVSKEQYRYLVQGEYVQFFLSEMTEGPHKYQAIDVKGINSGALMCETLNETGRQIRSIKPRNNENRSEQSKQSKQLIKQDVPKEKDDWKIVSNKKETNQPRETNQSRQRNQPRETNQSRQRNQPKKKN